MGEAAAPVTSLSKLPVHTLLSPICLYTTRACFALSSCCVPHLCHSICLHTSFQTGFCCFCFVGGFFLVPCSCCFPHTHVSLASLSHLTLSIKCPQSQRGICSLRRLLQVLTALQLHQHRHKGVCKPKYPSRVPRGLKLVETPWGSLVKEERQYF